MNQRDDITAFASGSAAAVESPKREATHWSLPSETCTIHLSIMLLDLCNTSLSLQADALWSKRTSFFKGKKDTAEKASHLGNRSHNHVATIARA